MKELILNREGLMLRQSLASTRELTTQARERYSKGGEIFMEGKPDMSSQPINPEHAGEVPQAPKLGVEKPVSAERQAAAREAWDKVNGSKTLPFEERRIVDKMISMGRGPIIMGGADVPDAGEPPAPPPIPSAGAGDAGGEKGEETPQYKNPLLQNIVNEIEVESKTGLSEQFLLDQRRRIQRLIDEQKVDVNEALSLSQAIGSLYVKNFSGREMPPGFWMKLKPDDFSMLREGKIEDWVKKKYDTLYRTIHGTRVTDSPYFNDMQSAYAEATTFLADVHKKPEEVDLLRSLFQTRLNNIAMASSISTKNMENVMNTAGQLQATGLLHGLSLDSGRVGTMFNGTCEMLEDMRGRTRGTMNRGHVTPAMVEEMRRNIVDEELNLAKSGVGEFAEVYKTNNSETETRADIVRAMNTAYDILTNSQRLHVIAARGKELFGTEGFFSDAGGTFRVFNIEAFTSAKWKLLSAAGEKLNRLVKDSLVEEWLNDKKEEYEKAAKKPYKKAPEKQLSAEDVVKIKKKMKLSRKQKDDLGDLLLKEISPIPDFFSSGWRIKGMLDQMDHYFAHIEMIKQKDKSYDQLMSEFTDSKKNEYTERFRKAIMKDKWQKKAYESLTEEQKKETYDQLMSELTDDKKDKYIKKFKEEIIKDKGAERANDFALFLRLRGKRERVKEEDREDDRGKVWKKIIEYRPEELVRLIRDRVSEEDIKAMSTKIFNGPSVNNYDDFKEKFGGIIRALREEGLSATSEANGIKYFDPYRINFADLRYVLYAATPEQQRNNDIFLKLNRATDGKANEIISIYKNMQNYIKEKYLIEHDVEVLDKDGKPVGKKEPKITMLFEYDPLFADIYSRTLVTDDAFLGRLEDAPSEFTDMISLSKRWAADIGSDALVRNMTDLNNGHQAVDHYFNFLKERDEEKKLEEAQKCASFISNVNGLDDSAKVMRHTFVTFLRASKLGVVLEGLGVKNWFLNVPVTKAQEIFGPAAKTYSLAELRVKADQLRDMFKANLDQEMKRINVTDWYSVKEKAEKIKDARKKADKQRAGVEKVLEIAFLDRVKTKTVSIIFGLILFAFEELLQSTGMAELAKKA